MSAAAAPAALVHVSLDGKRDLKIPDNVRIYMWASAQHGPASRSRPAKGIAQQMTNPNDYYWAMRAIFAGLDGWVRQGAPPPPSRYPKLSDGTLVPHDRFKFPAIPGVQSPAIIPGGYRADLGGPLTAPDSPISIPRWTPTATTWAACACRRSRCRWPPIPAGISARPNGRADRDRSFDGFFHSLCRDKGRAGEEWRSPPFDRGTLSQPCGLSRSSKGRRRCNSSVSAIFWPRMSIPSSRMPACHGTC